MGWTRGTTALATVIFAAASLAASAGEEPGADGGGTGPTPHYRNAALPRPEDLVTFDTSPVRPDMIVELDELGAGQAAFPLNYGGDVKPSSGHYDGVARGGEPTGTADIVVPLPAGGAAAAPSGYVDYQDYLTRQQAAPEGAAGATATLPELRADTLPEPQPLPPPPLPELPGQYAVRPDPSAVKADFDRLQAFCEQDNLGSAAEVYAAMPDFGPDEEVNRIRADAANLLILGLARTGNLPAARTVYDSVPRQMAGFDAMLAKARAVINLTTYYVRAEQYNDAYAVLMDIGGIPNRSALNHELFRLMSRMIPYLDNAEETDKAQAVYDQLVKEVKSPGTAALFADNARSFIRYYLHYVDKTDSPLRRRKRLDFLEHVFASLEVLAGNTDVAMLRQDLGDDLAARYAGNPERAARFYVEKTEQ